MSEATPATESRSPGDQAQRESLEQKNVREYTALRARRASRVSLETAAARRRLVTAGVGTALTVLVAVLAIVGAVSWVWLLAPAAFLVGTVAASMVAADRAKQVSMAEDARLAELRPLVRGTRSWEASAWDSARAEARAASKVSQSADAKIQDVNLVSASTPEESARAREQVSPVPQAADVDNGAAVADVEVVVAESAEVTQNGGSLPRVAGGEWDYVPMPTALHARRAAVQNRAVHTHTDIRGNKQIQQAAAVPGRPVRATARPMSIEEIETSSTPTFRFDLDAVLDQRRAQ